MIAMSTTRYWPKRTTSRKVLKCSRATPARIRCDATFVSGQWKFAGRFNVGNIISNGKLVWTWIFSGTQTDTVCKKAHGKKCTKPACR